MLVNIQLLRLLAALLVVLYHTSPYLGLSGHAVGPLFAFGRDTGFAGVDIFFVISGFIMAWTTQGLSGPAAALDFMKRRLARIYSGYWIFFFLALALVYSIQGERLASVDLAGSFLLWPTELGRLLIPVSWTLIFELFFYVCYGLMIALLGARRRQWTIGLFLLALAWSLYSQFLRNAYAPGNLEMISVYENYWAFPFLIQFLAGAMLGDWLYSRRQGAGATLLLAGISLWLAVWWLNAGPFGGALVQGYQVMWRVILFGLPSLLLVAGLARLEFSGRVAWRGLSMLGGGASYALYLSHTLILAGLAHLGLFAALKGVAWPAAQFAYLALVVLITLYSIGHYKWLERRAHRAFRRLLAAA